MRLIRFLILVTVIPIPSSLAEYRAYELIIENAEKGTQRRVVTTLDHIQYPSYYPLQQTEKVLLAKSWMCWGTSDYHQDICPAPENQNPERFPAEE